MDRRRVAALSPFLIVGVGTGLFLASVLHHTAEVRSLGRLNGPLLALLLDALLALTLAYGGYWLSGTDLGPERRWMVVVWCLAGAALFVTVIGGSVLIRLIEGRTMAEPPFELLLAATSGGIAGLLAGYYHARAREDAHDAERARNALAFVNDVLRHDLRNDLTVVRISAASIEDDAETETVEAQAGTIRERIDGAIALIESTGTMAETLTGEAALDEVDLASIAAESAERVDDAYDATVTTDLPESAPVVANSGIRSVVDNLVENAAEHNDAGDPRIGVSVETNAETVRLRVRDNGTGIPDGRKEEVFDARERGTHGGGLHLVATLVDSYDGDVRVVDDESGGAVFVAEFPPAKDA